jgi:uncharacterized membrane protein YebE (DUF533 family)
VDLNRTDELPVLDVAAYEASLALNDKSLSRTDPWAVEALRAVDGPVAGLALPVGYKHYYKQKRTQATHGHCRSACPQQIAMDEQGHCCRLLRAVAAAAPQSLQ